jgi:hypothetical protein
MSGGKSVLSRRDFIRKLPDSLIPNLPVSLQGIKVRQPWGYLIQFHYGEPWLHYEVSRAVNRNGYELGFHCESKDKDLNRYLLFGFRQHLFEIKDELGDSVEAEMWDRGWTKIYEVIPEEALTADYQMRIALRMVRIIVCLHPIYVELRGHVARAYR